MRSTLLLLAGLLLAAPVTQAVNDVPNVVNYQGKLLNSSGNQVSDGTYTIQFKLYNASSGTSFLWGSSYSVVVSGGYFNVILGEGGTSLGGTNSISAALASTSTPYLGLTITVDSTGATITNPSEITPRMRFLSSPYSLVAQNARYADTAATATNALTLGNLQASAFLQPASAAATTLSGNLTVPTLNVTGSVVNSGSETVTGNVTVNGTLTAAATSGGGFVPVGGIILWSGSTTTLPAGWALCNGSGTFTYAGVSYAIPDLRDRFVVGAGNSYAQRATGGNTTVTLGLNNIPQHRHIFRDTIFAENNMGGGGRSPDGLSNGADGGNNYVGSHSGYDWDNNLSWVERYSYFAGGNASGGTDAFDVRPPYYALAYIIRVN